MVLNITNNDSTIIFTQIFRLSFKIIDLKLFMYNINKVKGKLNMAMTSRERVQAVLNYETPDRVPIIIGVSNATGIKIHPYRTSPQRCARYSGSFPERGL